MKTIIQAQTDAHKQIEHIIGNVKGNVVSAEDAIKLLDAVVTDTLNSLIRYDAEVKIENIDFTQINNV